MKVICDKCQVVFEIIRETKQYTNNDLARQYRVITINYFACPKCRFERAFAWDNKETYSLKSQIRHCYNNKDHKRVNILKKELIMITDILKDLIPLGGSKA